MALQAIRERTDSRSAIDTPSIELMTGTLVLVEYDPRWPQRFGQEAARVRAALGELAKAIEHVGSTAVPGLMGKPVLDIAVAVESESVADRCVPLLETLGFSYRGLNGDDPRRHYYVAEFGGKRSTQLHLYILPAPAWEAKLAFRDALRGDPALVAAYATEKRRVAEAVAWDKAKYAVEKGPFILEALKRLL